VKIALLVAYDGTGFRGAARQRGRRERTVQGLLDERLAALLRGPVRTTLAGRTDAGVHARGQVVSFGTTRAVDPAWLRRRLNRWLAPDIVVRAAAEVPDTFDARHSARRRTYEYSLYRSDVPDPFREPYAVRIEPGVNVAAMRSAAPALVGEHDYASFCRAGEGPTLRRVRTITVASRGGGTVVVRLVADSFCQQMVRSIVGTLLQVGAGERDAADVARILEARDRAAAGPVAPARGLTLVSVTYRPDPFQETTR
jgi:tRNA pseudouridine38-40 synthase